MTQSHLSRRRALKVMLGLAGLAGGVSVSGRPVAADERLREKRVQPLVAPAGIRAEVDIVYQTVEHLHEASPAHRGDWYFTGDYPTPGGNKVANRSLVLFAEGSRERAY